MIHEQRARIMYGPAAAKPAAKPAKPIPRAAAKKVTGHTGSHDIALRSYYERYEASLRDDPEHLERARAERKQLMACAQKRNVSPEALHTALSALRDHESRQRFMERKALAGLASRAPAVAVVKTPEQRELEARARYDEAYKAAFEKLRLQEGSEAAAVKVWDRMRSGLDVLASECPLVAARANAPEVAADIRTIRFLASLVEQTPQPPAAAAQET